MCSSSADLQPCLPSTPPVQPLLTSHGISTALTVFLCYSDHPNLAMLQELCQRLQRYFANLREVEPLVITFEVDRHPSCHLPLWCCMPLIWCAYAERGCGRKVLPTFCWQAGGASFV